MAQRLSEGPRLSSQYLYQVAEDRLENSTNTCTHAHIPHTDADTYVCVDSWLQI